jgi:hypothetical protein
MTPTHVGRRRLKNDFYQMQRDGALHEHRSTSEGAMFEQCQSCHDFSHSADGRRQEGRTVRCGLPSSKFCGRRLVFLYSVAIFDLLAYRSFHLSLSYQSFVCPLGAFEKLASCLFKSKKSHLRLSKSMPHLHIHPMTSLS